MSTFYPHYPHFNVGFESFDSPILIFRELCYTKPKNNMGVKYMKIHTAASLGTTLIQNEFIDQYMPHANGEFVKVYLYLLRCAGSGRDLSLSSIADVFDHTEKDIQRALIYWEKLQLLRLGYDRQGNLSEISLQMPGGKASKSSLPAQPASVKEENDAPTPARIAELSQEKEIRQLFFIAEQYLQRPLSSSEQSDFIYYYDSLKFSSDLIEYLLEYCISKGSSSRHYMRKVALSWAEAGISTVLQAKEETNLYNKNYFTILNAFGIKGRSPASFEQEMMSHWLNDLGFSVEIVLEACRRTVRQTHEPNFQYANKILEDWRQKKVSSLGDIKALDLKRRAQQQSSKAAPKREPVRSASSNRFHNFSQRDYDYGQLEKQLLNQ